MPARSSKNTGKFSKKCLNLETAVNSLFSIGKMGKNVLPQRVIKRAEVLFFKGFSLTAISKKLHINKNTLSKYRKNWDDRLPNFTVDDLLDDCDTVFFLALQEAIEVLRTDASDIDRLALNLQKLGDIVKNISALAPMRSAKNAKENALRLMDEIKATMPPEQAKPILDVLQADYERAMQELEAIALR